MALGEFLGGAAGGATISILIRAVDNYSKEFSKLDKSVQEQTSGFKKLTGFLKSSGIGYAALAGAAVSFGIQATKAFLDTERASQAFNTVVGETAGILLGDLQKASKGMVSNFNLMQAANRALMLGINKNQLPQLMEIATVRGKVMGRTVTEAFDDITLGIGRQSKLILDNLGIIVNMDDAYKEYAEQLGKTSAQLTELEKKQAFVNAVIEQSIGLTEAMKYAEETHNEKLARLNAMWENLKSTMGGFVVEAYDVLLESTGELIIAYDLWSDNVVSPEVRVALGKIGDEVRAITDEMKLLRDEQEGLMNDLKGITEKTYPEEIRLNLERLDLEGQLLNASGDKRDIIQGYLDDVNDEIRLFDIWKQKQDLQIQGWIAEKQGLTTTREQAQTDIGLIIQKYDENILKIEENKKVISDLSEQSTAWADTEVTNIDRVISMLSKLGMARRGGPLTGVLLSASRVPGFQTGGTVEQTGLAFVHKGEEVIPANKSSSSRISISIGNVYGVDAEDISRAILNEFGKKISL